MHGTGSATGSFIPTVDLEFGAASSVPTMPLPPDLSLYIPVVCETDSKYAGKCYMEPISAVRTLNGVSVSKSESSLKKSDFKTGDIVTVRFQNKDFRGTVDFARDEEVLCERVESPCSSSVANMAPSTSGQCVESTLKSDVNRKRKRHRSWDGLAQSESPAKRGVVTKGAVRKPRAPGIMYNNVHMCTCVYMYVRTYVEAR